MVSAGGVWQGARAQTPIPPAMPTPPPPGQPGTPPQLPCFRDRPLSSDAPPPPSGLMADMVELRPGLSGFRLRWRVPVPNALCVGVEVRRPGAADWSDAGQIAGPGSTHVNIMATQVGREPGRYCFRAYAANQAGRSPYSNEACLDVPAGAIRPAASGAWWAVPPSPPSAPPAPPLSVPTCPESGQWRLLYWQGSGAPIADAATLCPAASATGRAEKAAGWGMLRLRRRPVIRGTCAMVRPILSWAGSVQVARADGLGR